MKKKTRSSLFFFSPSSSYLRLLTVEEKHTSNEEARRCEICLRPIERKADIRIIRLKDSEFLAHAFCLLRLRRLACKLYQTPSPIPTLNRELTLNEFLLSKRPQNDAEIICCIASYLHLTNPKRGLTPSMVKKELRFAAFKITDIKSAFHEASEKLGYLRKHDSLQQEAFIITEKGLSMVKRLPGVFD
ncbi:MAG: hypothetical protein ACFFCF_10170 [Promethearchaeota archaeon]